MKLKILIALIVLINLSFVDLRAFKLLALGDTGQVDEWWQQNQILRITNLVHDKLKTEASKINIQTYAAEILAKMRDDPLDINDGKSPFDVFKNFGSFYTCKVLDHGMDSIVLLGDGIYTEHKAKGKIISPSFKPRTEAFTPENDIPDTIDKTLAKDYYFNLGTRAFGKLTQVYDKRTLYAAKKLGEMLVAPVPNPDPQAQPCFSGDANSISVLPGNHSFDVDQPLEEALIASQFEKVQANVPFLFEDKDKDNKVTVLFLDANLMQLACLDKKRFLNNSQQTTDILGDTSLDKVLYKECIKNEGGSRTLKSPEEARLYLALLVAKLVEIKNKPGHWRIFRTHNPIFNPEIDFNAALQLSLKYKCNGIDLSAIWSSSVSGNVVCAYETTAQPISLMSVFQNAGIDFFLVSHFHAAMVVAAPYSPTYPIGLFNGDASGLRCFDRYNDFFSLVDIASEAPVDRPKNPPPGDNSGACAGNFIGENKIYLQPAGSAQKFYLSFVIGNSGRYLDPIPLDTYSNGDIIWARSTTVQYIDKQVNDINKLNLQDNDFNSKESAKTTIEELWNKIRDNSKPSFGYSLLTFSEDGNSVVIEFYEVTGTEKKVTNRFNLVRGNPENGKTQIINKMYPKVIPDKPKKTNKKLLKKVK